jgi:hypothetical protein
MPTVVELAAGHLAHGDVAGADAVEVRSKSMMPPEWRGLACTVRGIDWYWITLRWPA